MTDPHAGARADTPSANCLMDNFAMRVVGAYDVAGKDDLEPVLRIALNHHGACRAYAVKSGVLFLYWTVPGESTPLLTAISDAKALHGLVVPWLADHKMQREVAGGDVDEEPEAFEAWTNERGQGGGEYTALLAIKPRTRWLGK